MSGKLHLINKQIANSFTNRNSIIRFLKIDESQRRFHILNIRTTVKSEHAKHIKIATGQASSISAENRSYDN